MMEALLLAAAFGLADAPAPVTNIVPDVMPGDVELAVLPTPKRAEMGANMIVVKDPFIAVPEADSLRAGKGQLAQLFNVQKLPVISGAPNPEIPAAADTVVFVGVGTFAGKNADALKALPNGDQGYRLSVRYKPEQKRNVVTISSLTPQGAYYAIQTLRQISYLKDGVLYIRECDILDWPTFPARGSKRPSGAFEWALKGNFCYELAGDLKTAREHFADWYMAGFLPTASEKQGDNEVKGLLDASPAGVERALDWVRKSQAAGARDNCIHIDDQPQKLAAETQKLFKGNYQAALVHVMNAVYAEMKKLDPNATLYLCPQPYWTLGAYEPFAAGIKAAGGLPKDCGMMLCGSEITSKAIPAEDVERFSKAFGAQRKAIIYDNYLRDLDFGAVAPRSAELSRAIIGVSPERGTATTRATRLDWGWNPEAYDPDRSLLLACREFAGFENWKKLHDLVTALENALPGPKYQPRAEALARFEKEIDRAGQVLGEMQKLPNCGLSGRLQLPGMPNTRYQHITLGLMDEVALCGKALPLEDIERISREGLASVYRKLPAQDIDGLTRDAFQAIWLFDDEDGKSASDLTGNGNNGVLRGIVALVPGGRFGKALALSGAGGHVEIAPNPKLDGGQFTVMAWIKIKPSDRYSLLFEKKGPKAAQCFAMIVAHVENGMPYLQAGAAASVPVNDDRWHHLAGTFDGNTYRFYVDGKLKGQTPGKAPLAAGNGPIHIGAQFSEGPAARPLGYAFNIIQQMEPSIKLLAQDRRERILKYSYREVTATRRDSRAAPQFGDDFVVSGAGTPVPAEQRMRFACSYDKDNLYINLESAVKAPLNPGVKPQDDVHGLEGESVRIMIDPLHTHMSTFEFCIDPYGNRYDACYEVGKPSTPQGIAYNSNWKSTARVTETGWEADIRIPLSSLGVKPAAGHVMGLQVWHNRTLWSYMTRWWGLQEPGQSGHLILE